MVLIYVPYTSLGRGLLLSITVEPECPTWSGSRLGSANLLITQWSNCLYLTSHINIPSSVAKLYKEDGPDVVVHGILLHALVCSRQCVCYLNDDVPSLLNVISKCVLYTVKLLLKDRDTLLNLDT